jgi:hypothetical protein
LTSARDALMINAMLSRPLQKFVVAALLPVAALTAACGRGKTTPPAPRPTVTSSPASKVMTRDAPRVAGTSTSFTSSDRNVKASIAITDNRGTPNKSEIELCATTTAPGPSVTSVDLFVNHRRVESSDEVEMSSDGYYESSDFPGTTVGGFGRPEACTDVELVELFKVTGATEKTALDFQVHTDNGWTGKGGVDAARSNSCIRLRSDPAPAPSSRVLTLELTGCPSPTSRR